MSDEQRTALREKLARARRHFDHDNDTEEVAVLRNTIGDLLEIVAELIEADATGRTAVNYGR